MEGVVEGFLTCSYAIGAGTDQNQLKSMRTILNTSLLPSNNLLHDWPKIIRAIQMNEHYAPDHHLFPV